jgi:acyl carrier protein
VNDLAVLTEIFREELDDPGLQLTPELSQEDIPAWDSLAHVRLIARIEERYGFQFSLSEIEHATSVAAMLDAIAAQG